MEGVKNEFNKRVNEINQYFGFLKEVEASHVVHQSGGSIDTSVRPILRANAILLLYNLLESTVIQAIDYIHISISTNDTLVYNDSIDEIKKIWIEYKYNNFKNQNDNSSRLLQYLQWIATDEIVIFDNNDPKREYLTKVKGIGFSGKIDAQQARKFAKKYGFKPNKRVVGKRLIHIKERRNQLAHGELSFEDCGNIYAFSELVSFKKETVLFLKEFLLNIEKYLNNQQYRRIAK